MMFLNQFFEYTETILKYFSQNSNAKNSFNISNSNLIFEYISQHSNIHFNQNKCMYTLKKKNNKQNNNKIQQIHGLILNNWIWKPKKRNRCPTRRWPRFWQFTHPHPSARLDARMVGSELYGTPDCHRYCCICGHIGCMCCPVTPAFGWFTRRTKGCLL